MAIDPNLILTAGGMIVGAGAAWGGALTVTKRTREDVALLTAATDAHKAEDNKIHMELVQRLSSIEGKLDLVLKR